jgi:purine nucleosidase
MFEENYLFRVVDTKKKKVLIDSDVRNEVDDQFAIMQALMTPMFEVQGIIAAHFGKDRIKNSMQASYKELCHLLEIAGLLGKVPIAHGCPEALQTKENVGYFGNTDLVPVHSEGVQLILDTVHALGYGEKLYLAVLGPLTDVAMAYMVDSSIANKIIVVWNGGAEYPSGGMEFNLVNDILAANIIFSSPIEVWQIPIYTYELPRVSLSELQVKVYPCGELGKYLFSNVIRFYDEMKNHPGWPLPESLDICDLAVTGVLMQEHMGGFTYRQAPKIDRDMFYHEADNRPIRVYHSVNYRYILEDLFAKLSIIYAGKK